MSQPLPTTGFSEETNGEVFIRTPKPSTACVLWGPYERLGHGHYAVTFRIEPEDIGDPSSTCCRIDVVKDMGRTRIYARDLSFRDLRENNGAIEVKFEMPESGQVEYRVFGTGSTGLRIAYDRSARAILDSAIPLERIPLAQEQQRRISYLSGYGVSFEARNENLLAKTHGVTVHIDSFEDFILLEEMFLKNQYTFVPPRDCMVVDIGMNVGFGSLAMAANPKVVRLLSFEPFKAPYTRAERNFQLNMPLSAKIKPHNFGLSDWDGESAVLSQELSTIGVSIRGNGSGASETIQIRDAASQLKQPIQDAVREGLGVVLKVDCEGSEFAIFESLERADLLKEIDAFMIEWHKWWSADKTQKDLIRPLQKAGFFVFDGTHLDDPYAGQMTAVRQFRS